MQYSIPTTNLVWGRQMGTVNEERSEQITDEIVFMHKYLIEFMEMIDIRYQTVAYRMSQYMVALGFILMLLIIALVCLVYFNYDSREQIVIIYERINYVEHKLNE